MGPSCRVRHEGPAFCLSLSGKEVEAGGGLWMPAPPLLARVRGFIDEQHPRLRRILDGPAAELLRLEHLVVMGSWPATLAATPRLRTRAPPRRRRGAVGLLEGARERRRRLVTDPARDLGER